MKRKSFCLLANLVRIDVGSGPSVLEVTLTLDSDTLGDTDRRTTVGDTGREGSDVSSLVTTSETEVVVGTVDFDVLHVTLLELLDHLLDSLHSSFGTSLVGRVAGESKKSQFFESLELAE
jgi:hypothetical protein